MIQETQPIYTIISKTYDIIRKPYPILCLIDIFLDYLEGETGLLKNSLTA